MHDHAYDEVTGLPYICPVDGCWFNECPFCDGKGDCLECDPETQWK